MSVKRVAFAAEMKKLEVKHLGSCDKGGRLVLDFNIPDEKLIGDLNALFRPDKEVFVVVMEKPETA